MQLGPEWRMGALRQALALAGYWTLQLDLGALPNDVPMREERHAPDAALHPSGPTLLLEGGLIVLAERTGARPEMLGRLEPGDVLFPVGEYRDRPGVSLRAGVLCSTATVEQDDLLLAASRTPSLAARILEGQARALEDLHWVLRQQALGAPAARVAALLLRVAETHGVEEPLGLRLAGAPDARELSVLAGVSRENAVIALEQLIYTGTLHRDHGRLWLLDAEALRQAAQG